MLCCKVTYKPEQVFLGPVAEWAVPVLFTVVAESSCDKVAGGGFTV